jgi:hypothetical protein
MDAVEELDDPQVPICRRAPRAGYQPRHVVPVTQPAMPVSPSARAQPRQLVTLSGKGSTRCWRKFVDQPPRSMKGCCRVVSNLASIRTMYRLLAAFARAANDARSVADEAYQADAHGDG